MLMPHAMLPRSRGLASSQIVRDLHKTASAQELLHEQLGHWQVSACLACILPLDWSLPPFSQCLPFSMLIAHARRPLLVSLLKCSSALRKTSKVMTRHVRAATSRSAPNCLGARHRRRWKAAKSPSEEPCKERSSVGDVLR